MLVDALVTLTPYAGTLALWSLDALSLIMSLSMALCGVVVGLVPAALVMGRLDVVDALEPLVPESLALGGVSTGELDTHRGVKVKHKALVEEYKIKNSKL